MSAHTPGPWDWDTDDLGTWINSPAFPQPIAKMGKCTAFPTQANARLIAAAPDMLAALLNVRKLISEAAMTGFNCKDGDWAERLFASQQITSAAIAKATEGQS